jgi:predicted dienelactone hydrolase
MKLASFATAAVFVLFVRQVSAQGFERVTVPDPMDKPLEVAIWYPSAAPISQQRDNPAGQSLALGGPVNGEHLPLIVVSHGNGGFSDTHADTALALADAGFVVAAVTHTGDNYSDESYPASRWMVDRPRHIRLVIDYMLNTWRGHNRIDPLRVGMFGFSAGGYTALVMLGGIPDVKRSIAHCAEVPQEPACKLGFTQDFADPIVAAQLSKGWAKDPRIKAAVIAAPGLGFEFDPASISRITAPVDLWAAAEDKNVPYATNTDIIRIALRSPVQFHSVEKAGHYDFMKPCDPRMATALPKLWARLCVEVPGFDRTAFHVQFNAEVVSFFNSRLVSNQ